jgi:hypothetical protein
MSRTVEQISKDITEVNRILSQEIEAIHYSQRPAVQMSMIQASERMPKLLEEMKSAIIPSRLVGLFANGDDASIGKVAEFLTSNSGVVLDAAQLYRTITDLVEPSYSRDRTFCTTQYSLMIQKVSEIGTNLGYLEIESPKYKESICPDTSSTMAHIRSMLRGCRVGDQANVDLLTKTLIDIIVKNKINSKQIPVMIIGTSSKEEQNAIATLFNRTFDYTFPPNFKPDVQKIVNLFKSQKQEQNEKETN